MLGQCFKDVDPVPSEQTLLSGLDDFFAASNRFSLKLLHALNTSEEEDAFFSPFSIWSSMILLFLGSRGTTERELEGVLGLQGMDKSLVAHSYLSLKLWFTSKIRTSTHTSFAMVNNLFLQKDIQIRNCLLQFLDDNVAYVDFTQNPDLARLAINYWISHETKNRITEILPPFSVQSFTRFVITSTMYLKGAWMQQFLPHATKPRPFFVSNSAGYLPVHMMVTRDMFLYATSDELQCAAIEMPYMGRSLTMVIMLPNNKAHGVQILISSLTGSRLDDLVEDMFPREVVVVMPKFQLESSFQLSSTLFKMGFRDLYTGALNLTGFTQDNTLKINAVYHKAFISVDEKGTEASAGTVTAVSRSSRPTRSVDFVVDRPFVFYIRENHSGSILFMGIVRKPKHTSNPAS